MDLLTEQGTLDGFLKAMAELQASDLHLKARRPPLVRVNGRLVPLEGCPDLDPDHIESMLESIVPSRSMVQFGEHGSVDFGYGVAGVARFRASIYYQRGSLTGVFRRVPFEFPTLEEWGHPPVLEEFCDLSHGLVLLTGPTGSGKSSTLAAMVKQIADHRESHVVCIEDPIEFLFKDNLASISQREIGTDAPDFAVALRAALRQDPDVIVVGEMRDEDTIRTVLTGAETGHLVFSTVHANSADQTIDRVVSSFHENSHRRIRQQLSEVIQAVISLQLVPRADGNGRVAAVEVMTRTPQIAKLISQGDLPQLREEIESSVTHHRMQSMNQSLAALVIYGTVDRETAMNFSPNPDGLDLLLRKTVGEITRSPAEGDEMRESVSDFSKILELQEIRSLYEDLKERHDQEIESRDREIDRLQAQVRAADAQVDRREDRASGLEQENARLQQQIEAIRTEYEGKLERLNARVRDLSSKANESQPASTERRGLFRR